MPETTLVDAGAVAVILYLVFKFIMDFRGRKNGAEISKLASDIKTVRTTIEQVNGSGVPILNARPALDQQNQLLKSLEEAIDRLGDRLSERIDNQTKFLKALLSKEPSKV